MLGGPEDVLGPRALHPIFFVSFDWHSCVHGYWLLARLLRRFPSLSTAGRIADLFDERFTEANVAGECAYIERPGARGFERPYGWGWLLALQAELERHATGPGQRAAGRLRPLAAAFAKRFADFLPFADYPVRTGVHSSTAFALRLAANYAEDGDPRLFSLMRAKGWQKYSGTDPRNWTVGGLPLSNDEIYSYKDWKVGFTYTLPKDFTIGLMYTDTSGSNILGYGSVTDCNAIGCGAYPRNLGNGTVTAYIQKTF